jgi:hypothetical protein
MSTLQCQGLMRCWLDENETAELLAAAALLMCCLLSPSQAAFNGNDPTHSGSLDPRGPLGSTGGISSSIEAANHEGTSAGTGVGGRRLKGAPCFLVFAAAFVMTCIAQVSGCTAERLVCVCCLQSERGPWLVRSMHLLRMHA